MQDLLRQGSVPGAASHENWHQAAGVLCIYRLGWDHIPLGGRLQDPAVLRVPEIRGECVHYSSATAAAAVAAAADDTCAHSLKP